MAAIRQAYYAAYQQASDPRLDPNFGQPPGLPESSVLVYEINHQGRSAIDGSYYVAATACLKTLVNCQDQGGLRAFRRPPLSDSFEFVPDSVCALPGDLFWSWYPVRSTRDLVVACASLPAKPPAAPSSLARPRYTG